MGVVNTIPSTGSKSRVVNRYIDDVWLKKMCGRVGKYSPIYWELRLHTDPMSAVVCS